MHGPTRIFWANLTPFSLQRLVRRLAQQLFRIAVGGPDPEQVRAPTAPRRAAAPPPRCTAASHGPPRCTQRRIARTGDPALARPNRLTARSNRLTPAPRVQLAYARVCHELLALHALHNTRRQAAQVRPLNPPPGRPPPAACCPSPGRTARRGSPRARARAAA